MSDFWMGVIGLIGLIAVYAFVAANSYGPYGWIEQACGYAGCENETAARHGTRGTWLIAAMLWPVTLGLASLGWVLRKFGALATWLRVEI
jgi:hypothetical protein